MLLSIPSAVQFGSRALGVSTPKSDYDIALLYSDLPSTLKPYVEAKHPINCYELKTYFNIHPPNNDGYILQLNTKKFKNNELPKVDIVILKNEKNLKIIQKAVELTKTCRKEILKHKLARVGIYQANLLNLGFIDKYNRYTL